ncbi:DNA polymerase I [Allopusillimonas soli]|uniref:DNA polymerase I n=1 Tax=Allopusillimonas soli TaxID=659016 RepID=A0A853FI18_9BURK|nr:DNA polymerase I [Allopusillimonas soli]NYT38420.1 DNA polymerase I [Allopusillimonas soli]TEA72022.1 DNA polymerase I [Allopusillimonas soli]
MKKTLLLVDGSSYLYRAYHAMPDLRNARGEPTGALYGVISMLRRLAQDYKADYAACVFDAKGKTFREDIYPLYKENRPSMPEELAAQIAPIHRAVTAMGWPVLSIPGVEADDVIGTLACRATREGVHTIISTGDKDLAQLVDEHVELVNTMSGDRQDIAGVIRKFGVTPAQIVDYLMLTGDAVDNVPGVDKVGPKTAAKWLTQYGSVETLIEHAAEIKGVAGKNLQAAVPNFPLTRELLTIRTDCDIPEVPHGLGELLPRDPDRDALVQLYEEYGFRTWLRELTGDPERIPEQDSRQAADQPAAPMQTHYETILDMDSLSRWLARIQAAELVALDTETTSLDPMCARLVGLSLSTEPGHACYIPVAHRGPDHTPQLPKKDVLDRLRPWLEDAGAAKLLHNAKYDTHVLLNEGIALSGITDDTMLQAYVLESHRRVNMQELAERWLGRTGTTYEDLCGKGAKQIGFDEVDVGKAAFYASEDADFTLQLHGVLRSKVAADPGLERIYQLEVQASRVLTVMEHNGVRIDARLLAEQSAELGKQLLELEQRAHELAGQPFNLNSPKQLGEILFQRMALPVVRKTASGAPSTDEDVLNKLARDYPLPALLLEYRGLAKLKSTYTDKLPRMINPATGRVHTRYAQAAVITGRLASSDPNLQNIPVRTAEGRRVRAAFVATGGSIVSADYSQIELRVMAHVSDDDNLRQAFERGDDIHRATAAEVFGVAQAQVTAEQRRAAKAINFGLIYGMGEFGLAANLGITRDAARSYIDRYFARYPGVAAYMAQTKAMAQELGYVETVFGRRLWLPELRGAKGPRRAAAERAAINAPMQGTAADLIKMAMVAVQDWLQAKAMRSLLVMQVHDELVLDVPADEVSVVERELPQLMSNVAQLTVPLVAEVGAGPNWEQAH